MESGQGPQEVAVDSGQASTTALLRDGLGQLSLGPADPGSAAAAQPPPTSPASAPSATSKGGRGGKRGQGKNAKAKRQQLSLATCEHGRLSLSDPSNLRANASSGLVPSRSPLAGRHPSAPLSASPSPSLSGAASWGPTRDRAGSDPRRGGGASGPTAFLPPGLKEQHAAHRCKRTGGGRPPGSRSDSGSSPLASSSHVRRSPCSPSSAATLSEGSFPSSRRNSETHLASPSFSSQRPKAKERATRYEAYMPLCEVQQALKKGEVVEGVLRINPRNYEDAFISAPDSQMDIYIGGLHDRNRALNGDVVTVEIKPQEDWRILWDRIQLWEQKTGESIYNFLENCGRNAAATADRKEDEKDNMLLEEHDNMLLEEDEEEGCPDELPESPMPTWDGSSPTLGAPRPSDTIEVLGIERLIGQVQEYVQTQRRNGKCNSRKPGARPPGRVPMPCSLEASLAPLPSELMATVLDRDRLPPEPEPQPQPARECPATVDPWAETEDLGSTMVFSPEELLEVPEEERQHRPSSPHRGCAVAPDELSGEDDWSSDAESTGSTALEQHLEDMAFLQASLDARNNNTTGFNNSDQQDNDSGAPTSTRGQTSRAGASVAERIGRSSAATATKVDGVTRLPPLLSAPAAAPATCSGEVTKPNGGWGERPLTWGLTPDTNKKVVPGDKPASIAPVQDTAASQAAPNVEQNGPIKACKGKKVPCSQRRKARKKGQKVSDTEGALSRQKAKQQDQRRKQLTVADVLRHPLSKRFVQRTGKVVHILETKSSRVTAGLLRPLQDRNPAWVLFSPRDSRFPRLMVPSQECPPSFFERTADFANTLFLAEMTKWLPDSTFAQGRLLRLLGTAGSLEVETNAILESYGVDHQDFAPDVLNDLGVSPGWKVPEEELVGRRDFRDQLVFTVDPKTARDLDDAISCRRLIAPDGEQRELWEVGVHIADVSHFVRPGTQLDKVAQNRATSVYLVEQVIPMLPRLLCDKLCSLQPGEDKLTFSVVWTLTSDGRVLSEWFGRSIIRSCCKLSYEHAQDLLDDPRRQREPGELPEVLSGYTVAQITECLHVLRGMTEAIRKRRFKGGALRLDQVKVVFSLGENFQPYGFSVYEHTESHRLIEELMLLANMAVAHRLYKAFPDHAFLRSHPPPDDAQMVEVEALCSAHGVTLDTTTAGTLQASLNSLVGTDDELSRAKLNVLTHMLSKPMKMAVYFCAGHREDPLSFTHYALNVPLYTHFTSPIRRYADIVVHRQLAAALGCGPTIEASAEELQKVADHCNDNKYKARTVQELSTDMFLHAFVEQCGSLVDRAMVVAVLEHAFDVLALGVGMVKRVYCDKLGVKEFFHSTEGGRHSLELHYQSSRSPHDHVVVHVGVFEMLDVLITAVPKDPLKYQVVLKLPPGTVPVMPAPKKDKAKGQLKH